MLMGTNSGRALVDQGSLKYPGAESVDGEMVEG